MSEELEKVNTKAAADYAQFKVDRLALEQEVQTLTANVKQGKDECEQLTTTIMERDSKIAQIENKYKEQQLELNKTQFELGQLKQSTDARISQLMKDVDERSRQLSEQQNTIKAKCEEL